MGDFGRDRAIPKVLVRRRNAMLVIIGDTQTPKLGAAGSKTAPGGQNARCLSHHSGLDNPTCAHFCPRR